MPTDPRPSAEEREVETMLSVYEGDTDRLAAMVMDRAGLGYAHLPPAYSLRLQTMISATCAALIREAEAGAFERAAERIANEADRHGERALMYRNQGLEAEALPYEHSRQVLLDAASTIRALAKEARDHA